MKFLSLFLLLICGTVRCIDPVRCFAVLNLKKVASSSLAGKDIERQIEIANRESKKGLLDLEAQIRSMESNKTSEYDARKIEDAQIQLYEMVHDKKYQISEAYKKAVGILDAEMKKVIKEICSEKNLAIVINSEAVVYYSEECPNITDEVIKRLNDACKTIAVELKQLK
ncbi:MAG: OmpH family outer membrane protein [Holosporaceae bacterium]|jgi:Skp family chaperone for outer membrane proteins|nr:OmpH family outer membrane protein [Holosporaceae bacterium]